MRAQEGVGFSQRALGGGVVRQQPSSGPAPPLRLLWHPCFCNIHHFIIILSCILG